MEAHEARLNVTWNRQAGDLPDPIPFDARDEDILQWAKEAIQGGSIPGIAADPDVDLQGFHVEKFEAVEGRAFHSVVVRPKTPFG